MRYCVMVDFDQEYLYYLWNNSYTSLWVKSDSEKDNYDMGKVNGLSDALIVLDRGGIGFGRV